MRDRMSLLAGSGTGKSAAAGFYPDVVYLDPMFPHRQKSALVKKDARVFQSLVVDLDADALLPCHRLSGSR